MNFSVKVSDIAQIVSGAVTGDGNVIITSFAKSLDSATENDLAFIYDKKYFGKIRTIKAKAMILPLSLKEQYQDLTIPVIWVERPRVVLRTLLGFLQKPRYKADKGIHKTAIIDPSAKIGNNCAIGANVFIGPNTSVEEGTVINPNTFIGSNVSIGRNCLLNANCTVHDYTIIGNNVVVYSGVVLGSDGFSYVTDGESNWERAKRGDMNFSAGRQLQNKIPSVGNVVIEDDVEIGANSCIDAGTIGSTVVSTGTKIDNMVMIAHNVKIGKDCLVVAQVGIAGSVNIGDRVVIGGQCGFADNMNVGDDVIFVGRSATHGNVPSRNIYMGIPAVPYTQYIKSEKTIKRIPKKQEKLEEQVKELENKLKDLESKLKIQV